MRIFTRNHERDPAQEARSSVWRKLRSKKGRQAQREAGSVAFSVSGNSLDREERSGDGSGNPVSDGHLLTSYKGSPTTQTLWDRAYDTLREENRQLVEEYEKLLSKELLKTDSESNSASSVQTETTLDDGKNVIDNTNRQIRQAQLAAITKRGLERINGNKIEYHIFGRTFVLKDQIAQAVGLVQWAKDWIGEAVKVSPEASIAWAGVCVVLPLLTNPSAADAANRDGFAYVTNRMRYYIALEPLLLQLVQDSSITKTPDSLAGECKAHIVDLYQHILEFQFRSVLRFYRNWLGNIGRDLVQREDWKQMQLKTKSLEDIVYSDFIQINDLVSRQKLDCLNEKTEDSLQNLYQILSTAMEQLRATEDIRDLTSDHIKLTQTLAERHQQNQKELDKKACHQVFRITNGEKDDSYEWYKNRVEDRVDGTCKWFLTHENFKSWLKEDAGPLLVSADPGCGKSVLAKYLIDYGLPRSATICYFFFKDQDQNTLSQALCALLHQLFSQKFGLIQHAMPEYSKNGSGIVTVTTTLWKILKDAAQDPAAGPTIFVLDALDECAETDFRDLIRMLLAFLQEPSKLGRVKFLLTSRPYENVVSDFFGLVNTFPYIRIPGEDKSEAISQEVNSVIRHRVQQLQLSADIRGHLERRLMEIPHRTYLWVYLVFDYLKASDFKKTKKGIELIIATLPESINQAYEKILEKHKDPQMVRKALSIILAASRPLTLAEMNIAVNIDISSRSLKDLDLEREDDFKRRLRSWCGLFVSIYHGKVYFLHQTAREFLLANLSSPGDILPASRWHHSISIHQAHVILAEVCVVYLNFLNSDPTLIDTNGETSHYKNKYTLLDYSAKNWSPHFRMAYISDDADIVPFALRICDSDSYSYSAWSKIYWETKDENLPKHFPDLMVASYFGLVAVVKELLENGVELETKDELYCRTPLLWAAEKGHEAVVKLLIEKGAELETKDGRGRTPLSWAAEKAHEVIVKLLLEKGAELEAKDKRYGQTPLLWAAENGHEVVVKLLIDKGAKLETEDNYGRTSLLCAIECWHKAIVKLLLEKGAELETKNNRGRTPLSWAAEKGHEAIVKLLLEKGAKLETKDYRGQTPLSWSINRGHEGIVKLLLEKGAEIETKDDNGCTPLLSATKKGHKAVVKLLLEKGAKLETKDKFGQTPLSWAAEMGHEVVVKLLLEKGAELETKDDIFDRTPLSWAAGEGHEVVVKLLLEKGAELESKDTYGLTPLIWTANKGHEVVVKLLLEKGAELETKDNHGKTPLLWAVENGHEVVVKLLLEKGAELETKDNHGKTPLLWAVENGHDTIIKLLLEKGAKLEIEDNFNLTPLSWAAKMGHKAAVKLLLEKGAELETKDKYSQTPLLYAIQSGQEEVVKLLLEKGAKLETKDDRGRTPLIWAIENGYEVVVKLLLEKGAKKP